MTSVSASSRPAQPSRAPEPSSDPRPGRATEQDVRAMGEAFARARKQFAPAGRQPQQAGAGSGKAAEQPGKGGTAGEALRGEARDAGRAGTGTRNDALADVLHRDRERHEGGDGQGQSFGQAPTAFTPVAMPAMPAAHVDPSGFAQMLADLWTRENGKGAKEVSVRFGRDAWPATGARLVRNAAGTLDIALIVGRDGAGYGERLDGLQQHLADAGVGVGALAVESES